MNILASRYIEINKSYTSFQITFQNPHWKIPRINQWCAGTILYFLFLVRHFFLQEQKQNCRVVKINVTFIASAGTITWNTLLDFPDNKGLKDFSTYQDIIQDIPLFRKKQIWIQPSFRRDDPIFYRITLLMRPAGHYWQSMFSSFFFAEQYQNYLFCFNPTQ